MKSFKIFTETKNSFEGQLPDEKTLFVIRMHWFVLVRQGIIFALAIIPVLLMIFFAGYSYEGDLANFILFLSSLFFLFWWYGVFYMISMYYLNTWIITNHRLIESEQLGFFRRDYTELYLSKIQDISIEVEGFFETMFSFGMLEVQSAGAKNKFKMLNIENPLEIKEVVMKAYNDFVRTHPKGVE
jgi:hypothetical protein